MGKPSVIAIDGPAAAGKTTLGHRLAERLGYIYFDTGLMYRAVTYTALDRGIPLEDEDAVVELARRIDIDVKAPENPDGHKTTVLVGDNDVTPHLRTAVIDKCVSITAAYGGVREEMVRQQRVIARRGGIVMVGRDIGTVVLPDADLKLFLEADLDTRVQRRYAEYQRRGRPADKNAIEADLYARDERDKKRDVGPLRAADDAHIIDTSRMSIKDMVTHVMHIIAAMNTAEH